MARKQAISTPYQNMMHAEFQKLLLNLNGNVIKMRPQLEEPLRQFVTTTRTELRAMIAVDLMHYIQYKHTEYLNDNSRSGKQGLTIFSVDKYIRAINYLKSCEYQFYKTTGQEGVGYWHMSHPIKEFMHDFVVISFDRREIHPKIASVVSVLMQRKYDPQTVSPVWEIHQASGLPKLIVA